MIHCYTDRREAYCIKRNHASCVLRLCQKDWKLYNVQKKYIYCDECQVNQTVPIVRFRPSMNIFAVGNPFPLLIALGFNNTKYSSRSLCCTSVPDVYAALTFLPAVVNANTAD